jgi:hypothetical protein
MKNGRDWTSVVVTVVLVGLIGGIAVFADIRYSRKDAPKVTPVPGNSLDGYTQFGGATLLTIPAGRTWVGTLTIEGSLRNAGGSAAIDAAAIISTEGEGAIPAAGPILDLRVSVANSVGGAGGNQSFGNISQPFTIFATGHAPVTLITFASKFTQASFIASGALI